MSDALFLPRIGLTIPAIQTPNQWALQTASATIEIQKDDAITAVVCLYGDEQQVVRMKRLRAVTFDELDHRVLGVMCGRWEGWLLAMQSEQAVAA